MYLREERKINLGNLERERTIRGGSRGELQAASVLKELKLSHHLNKYYLLRPSHTIEEIRERAERRGNDLPAFAPRRV